MIINKSSSYVNHIKINADDFGLKSSVNKAIIEAFDKNFINSTTLMANMPGFEEAIDMIYKNKLLGKVGVHLVLTEGVCLTEKVKFLKYLFKGKEIFKKQMNRNFFFFDKVDKQLIYRELAAQIEKVQNCGISITHLDSHHHVHEFIGITNILLALKRNYHIPSIRILNNLEKPYKIYKHLYRANVNLYLKSKGANYSDFFGNQLDFQLNYKKRPSFIKNSSIEIMVHPDYNHEGKLIDKVNKSMIDFPDLLCNNYDV
jgi:chitin disaccharide deacetylase